MLNYFLIKRDDDEDRNPFKCTCPVTARVNDAYCPITESFGNYCDYCNVNVPSKYNFPWITLRCNYPHLLKWICGMCLNYLRTFFVGMVFKFRQRIKNSPSCVHVLHKPWTFGHLALLFSGVRQGNAPEVITYVQTIGLLIKTFLLCSVLVAVPVVVVVA